MSIGTRNTLAICIFVLVFFWAAAKAEPAARPVPLVICDVWGKRCHEALSVSWCESRWTTTARNGQYRGLFQVSGHWRKTVPGWGLSAQEQALHALRVFRKTGSNWRHWSCRP